jgi:urease accessory protein
MYLASPALPIGSFAWSRGLESAALIGAVTGLKELKDFLTMSLRHSLGSFDLPLLALALKAAYIGDLEGLRDLNELSLAGRESLEFTLEEQEGGKAIKRLALSLNLWPDYLKPDNPRPDNLGPDNLGPDNLKPDNQDSSFSPGLIVGQAILAVSLGLEPSDTPRVLEALAFAWLQNQIAAAARTLRLGQNELQNLLLSLGPEVTRAVNKAILTPLSDIGPALPGLAILSAHHELASGRLFRS